MSFRTWYYNEDDDPKTLDKPEQLFFDVVGVEIPSLKSFISWLILNKKITGIIRKGNKKKPVPVSALPIESQIHYLAKSVSSLETDAKEFADNYGNVDK